MSCEIDEAEARKVVSFVNHLVCFILTDHCDTLAREDAKHRRHHSTRHRSARDLADAELQRAIQLSLEEVGASGRNRPGYTPSQPAPSAYGWQTSEPPIVERSAPSRAPVDDEDDPDLRAAIEASLREANAPRPSAPIDVETPRNEVASFSYAQQAVPMGMSQSYPPVTPAHPPAPTVPNYDLLPLEEDVILTFSQTVEEVQAQGGRDISRYPGVTELHEKANGLKSKLVMSLDDTDRKQSECHCCTCQG
jgi:growth factor-regulated tyrosine kinase substrate